MIIKKLFLALSQLYIKNSDSQVTLLQQNHIESETMKLSKCLAQTSVYTSKEAEKIKQSGIKSVDGKQQYTSTSENKISIFTKNGENTIKKYIEIAIYYQRNFWIFYKPAGLYALTIKTFIL